MSLLLERALRGQKSQFFVIETYFLEVWAQSDRRKPQKKIFFLIDCRPICF